MFNAINTKLLLAITLALASIAGTLAYRNAQQAKKEAEAAREQAAIQKAIKTSSHNWGGSADTITNYRPK